MQNSQSASATSKGIDAQECPAPKIQFLEDAVRTAGRSPADKAAGMFSFDVEKVSFDDNPYPVATLMDKLHVELEEIIDYAAANPNIADAAKKGFEYFSNWMGDNVAQTKLCKRFDMCYLASSHLSDLQRIWSLFVKQHFEIACVSLVGLARSIEQLRAYDFEKPAKEGIKRIAVGLAQQGTEKQRRFWEEFKSLRPKKTSNNDVYDCMSRNKQSEFYGKSRKTLKDRYELLPPEWKDELASPSQ